MHWETDRRWRGDTNSVSKFAMSTDYFEEALLKSDTFLCGKIILSYQVNVVVIVEKIYSIID